MSLRVHLGALVLLLFCTSSSVRGEAEEISVEISSKDVVLSCPGEESQWEKREGNTVRQDEDRSSLIISTPEALDEIAEGKEFVCRRNSQNRIFQKIYLKIKVCKDCVELSIGLGAGIIIADLLLTLGVLLLVYFCCKTQCPSLGASLAGGGTLGRQQGQQADCPPPVPNPDYEPIRKGQREVYAGLEPRAF
ncbi:T-cell surface glycoprotein CD3 epsilon chain isoform 1-T2 [Liasis olivaceus]